MVANNPNLKLGIGIATVAAMLGVTAAPASAQTEYFPPAAATSDTLVEAIDLTWSGHRANPQMIQRGDHQIIVYYDANRQMTVAHRASQRTPWRYHKLDSWVGWDSHNYVTVEVDEAGYIHVMGNMHADPLVYFRSREPWNIRSMEQVAFLVDAQREQRVTYPRFDHDPTGRLIAAFRIGGSGNGSFYYHRFDTKKMTWSPLHDQPFYDGEGERSAYYIGPDRGPDGRFHMVWVWRETPSAATNNTLSYARSPDLLHWEDSNGQPIDLPITRSRGEIVDPVPEFGGMLNGQTKLGFDSDNAPMISYYRNDANGDTQIMLARKVGTAWRVIQVSDWKGSKQDLDRTGSLSLSIQVPEGPFVASDGTIRVRARRDGRPIEFVVDPQTGRTKSSGPYEAEAAVISGFEDIPGIPLNLRRAEGVSKDSPYDFYLSWQANSAFQDRARPEIPPPSTLRLHRIPR